MSREMIWLETDVQVDEVLKRLVSECQIFSQSPGLQKIYFETLDIVQKIYFETLDIVIFNSIQHLDIVIFNSIQPLAAMFYISGNSGASTSLAGQSVSRPRETPSSTVAN